MSLKVEPNNVDSSTLRESLRIGGEGGINDATESGATDGPSFASILESTAMAASAKAHKAVEMSAAVAEGKLDDLHGTMITMKEADISLKLVGNVRDKLLDAFHELWRTNV